jgi:hypothetical protein
VGLRSITWSPNTKMISKTPCPGTAKKKSSTLSRSFWPECFQWVRNLGHMGWNTLSKFSTLLKEFAGSPRWMRIRISRRRRREILMKCSNKSSKKLTSFIKNLPYTSTFYETICFTRHTSRSYRSAIFWLNKWSLNSTLRWIVQPSIRSSTSSRTNP